MEKQLKIAIVGLGFGAEFIPIFQRHPVANMYAICQRDTVKLNQVGDAFGIGKRARQSVNLTCVGILAKEPAMKGEEKMTIPAFTHCS